MVAFNRIDTCCTGMIMEELSHYSKEALLNDIRDKGQYADGWDRLDTHAVIIAITTERQTVAKEALREIGFAETGPFTKDGPEQRERGNGPLTVHTINALDLHNWIMEARANKDVEGEREAINQRRRFAQPAIPAVPAPLVWDDIPVARAGPREVPPCEIRNMRVYDYIRPEHRERSPVPQFRHNHDIPVRYGVTAEEYGIARQVSDTLADFTRHMRGYQRAHADAGQIRIVRD